MKRKFFGLFIALLLTLGCAAQSGRVRGDVAPAAPEESTGPSLDPMVKVGRVMLGGDSVQYVELNDIYIYPRMVFANKRQRMQYNRLVENVKKVLPLARECRQIVVETYQYLQTLPTKEAREKHMKYVEKSIRKEYTPRMKKLTYQQGKLLIKLIFRESNSSSYSLIQAFFGATRAGFYQTFAWLFGASLKKEYQPSGVDKFTERVVRQVESGQI